MIRYLHYPIVILLYPLLMPSPLFVSGMALFKILVSSGGAIVGYVLAESMVKGRDMRTTKAKKAVRMRCTVALVVALLVSIVLIAIMPIIREGQFERSIYFVVLLLGTASFSLFCELFKRRGT